MKTTQIVSGGAMNEGQLSKLVDQLDPAIGEATSVMGAMASELIRRTLRGGVLELGRELNGYVGQLVESQIIEQRPAIDKAAAETATEVARAEVETVRQSVSKQGQQLAARIDEASQQAEVQVHAMRQATKDQTQQLAARIEDASRQAHEQAEAVSRELAGRLETTSRQTHEKVDTLTHTLEAEVVAAETRTLDTARKEFGEQIDTLRERSRQTTSKVMERLDGLDAASGQLADLQRALKTELLDTLQTERRNLLQEIEALRRDKDLLSQRLDELEKPRGLRAVFAWLFGKKKKKPAAAESPKVIELAEEVEEAR